MAGEIAAAFLAVLPSMRGFGSHMVAQAGPQLRAASRHMGTESGALLGAAMGGSAAKSALPSLVQINNAVAKANVNTGGWLGQSASMAVKNVALYGSMYAAIQGAQAGIEGMFSTMVGFNAELEQSQIGFETLLKSASAADDQMAWIKAFAKETPFGYQDLVGYSQQLIALGFNAEESRRVLAAAGDAAAALGRGEEGIARINLALGQMWTKGKVQSQEMLQLTEAGIGAWQILADAYGTTVGEIQDKVTEGLISAKDAVPALLAGMEAQFGGLMAKQATTFTGTWANIQDTIQQQLAQAGEPLFDELKAAGQEFLTSLSDPEVQAALDDLGGELAAGARELIEAGRVAADVLGDVLPLVKDVWSNVKGSLPALAALTIALLAARKAQTALGTGGFLATIAADSRAAAAAVTTVTTPTKAMVLAQEGVAAAQRSALRASIDLGVARNAEATAATAAAEAAKRATDATTRGADASRASWAAQRTLAAATQARMVTNAQLVVSEAAVEAATGRVAVATEQAVVAQQRLARVGAVFRNLSGIGQALGMGVAVAGVTSLGDASASAEQKVLGVAAAMGGGALAGATMGGAAGAAVGAVVGLTVALVNLHAAQDAANKDTSETRDALIQIGVQAATASQFMKDLETNSQIDLFGGSQAIVDAVQQGGPALDAMIAKITAMRDAYLGVPAAVEAVRSAMGDETANGILGAEASAAAANVEWLNSVLNGLSLSASDAAYSQFLAVQASNAATGSYGEQAAAAYAAAQAVGEISLPLLQTGVAAEGASGKVGLLLNEITGLPVNTPINFSTNATDIWAKILDLRKLMASFGNNEGDYTGAESEIKRLEDEFTKALTSAPTVTPTIGLPTGGGRGAAAAAAAAAKAAAEEAARKLKQDQAAQLQFADAFSAIMEAALAGNFDQFRDRLEDQIKELVRDGYTAAADTLKKLSGTLTKAALDYSALTNKIKAAEDAQEKLTRKMQDQYRASVDLVKGLASVTDAQSFDQLAYLLGQTTTAAKDYEAVLKKLKDGGLAEDVWNQLAQAGPESLGLAQSILDAGPAGIEQLNELSGGLADAADSMGTLVSSSMYQSGVDAMKAYIEGLKSQAKALEDQLETIANNILDKTTIGITPGNAGWSPFSAQPQPTPNTYQVQMNVNADDFGDLQSIQDFIKMLNEQPTTQLVNSAGTVTS